MLPSAITIYHLPSQCLPNSFDERSEVRSAFLDIYKALIKCGTKVFFLNYHKMVYLVKS